MRDAKQYRHGYWRSLEHRAMTYDQEADSWKEFPPGADTHLELESLPRPRSGPRIGVGVSNGLAAQIPAA